MILRACDQLGARQCGGELVVELGGEEALLDAAYARPAEVVDADLGLALGRAGLGGGVDPLLDLLVGDAFLGRPLAHRQLQPERLADVGLEALDFRLGIGQ